MIRFKLQNERLMRRTQEPERSNPAFAPQNPAQLQNDSSAAISNKIMAAVHPIDATREPETRADALAPPARH
jgi:hypothetical protein